MRFHLLTKVGLLGEKLSVYTEVGSSHVSWSEYSSPSTLTWYKVRETLTSSFLTTYSYINGVILFLISLKLIYLLPLLLLIMLLTCTSQTTFDSPRGNDSIALNLGSMGKGEVWINGQSIGRYWVSFKTPTGSPSQTWFETHIDQSLLV